MRRDYIAELRETGRIAGQAAKRATIAMYESDDMTYAASIAYYALLSLFPVLLILISILSSVTASEANRLAIMGFVFRYFPSHFDFIFQQLESFRQAPVRLGIGGSIALVWASLGVFNAISSAVNHAWGVERQRNFFKHRLFSFLMLTTAGLLLLAVLLLATAVQVVEARWFANTQVTSHAVVLLRSFAVRYAALLLPALVFGLTYYFVPHVEVLLKDIWLGALITGLVWDAGLKGFSWFVRDTSRWSHIHGNIATVVVFLIWVYSSAVILLWGVEFTASYGKIRRDLRAAGSPGLAASLHRSMPNRLASERSPYLLQHAENPVDWRPWGAEALALAAELDRPIFLSIGYSTCHWCHVMAHESFEDPGIGRLLNDHFVSIKVDREERPDVDRVYMTFVQATTGAGGWPMSVWLTPDLQPFYGGTYFPPDARWGKPGFADVLREVARVWQQEREKVRESAVRLTEQIRSLRVIPPGGEVPPVDTLAEGVAQFAQMFDRERGGFGDAPKFPRPSELFFLLRETARAGDSAPSLMAARTVRAMAMGGMRDHVGGGFHRYSVDREWRVPHFEKMLYDQAQIGLACLELYQLTHDGDFAQVAEDTLQYVRRELTSPEGGFFSAEDADSVPPESADDPRAHKVEGAFYVWTAEELERRLGTDAEIFKLRYGVQPGGNAPHDPQGEFAGKNILYVARAMEDLARQTGRSPDDLAEGLQRARTALFAARLERPRPHLDDKVLTAWNGLMLAAFARAARVMPSEAGRRAHLESAVNAATFLRRTMWDEDARLLRRRYRAGEAGIDAYSEDYAYLIFGLLELFQTTGDARWLGWARALQRRMDELFWDEESGGWFNTTGRDPTVILRLKEDYDGAEPAPSSISVLNLLTIASLAPEPELHVRIEKTLKMFGPRLGQLARAVPMMAASLSAYHAAHAQIVLVGPRDAVEPYMREVAGRYLPFAVVVPVEPGPHQDEVAAQMPFITGLRMKRGAATAYVCRAFACAEPATDLESLRARLAGL